MMAHLRPSQGFAATVEWFLASQRNFMELYGDSLEQLLNVSVYFVPVEDDDHDATGFWSQIVYSVIDLFNLYKAVILRSLHSLPVLSPVNNTVCIDGNMGEHGPELQRSRLTYTAAAFLLRTLRSIQVLLEMHAQRRHGAEHALRVCMRIEAAKLVLKLVVRAQMPFSLYVDEDTVEDIEPVKAFRQLKEEESEQASPSGKNYVGRRTGKVLPGLEEGGPPRMLRRTDATMASPRVAGAELLHHARPFVHLWMLIRRGRKSWAAWFAAFLMDQISLGMLAPALHPQAGTRAARLEIGEFQRRRQQAWWALARSPVFEKILRRPCQVLDSVISRIPILNLFRIMELCLALQPFYFSTSAT